MDTGDVDASGLLRLAESALGPTVLDTRCAAILSRQSIELGLADLWQAQAPKIRECHFRAQFLCLPAYLSDADLAAETHTAWIALSSVCHYHPYELTPSQTELRPLLDVARAFAEEVRRQVLGAGR